MNRKRLFVTLLALVVLLVAFAASANAPRIANQGNAPAEPQYAPDRVVIQRGNPLRPRIGVDGAVVFTEAARAVADLPPQVALTAHDRAVLLPVTCRGREP